MKFYKYCGAGNDFIILDNRDGKLTGLSDWAKRLCDRHFSVGADGLIVVEAPEQGGDCKMRFFNSDGSAAEMCGNGARCLCRFCRDHGISGDIQHIETPAGPVTGWCEQVNSYRIQLNSPTVWKPQIEAAGVLCDYIELGENGIPHAVAEADLSRDREELREFARKLRHATEFPKGANVNLCQIAEGNTVRLLTFERGVEDFTLACGTGAGATVAALILRERLEARRAGVLTDGGALTVDYRDGLLFLTGEAKFVFEGELGDL